MHSPLPWFRLYSEFATDPKIQILEFDDQRHFVMLLCLKRNGTLDATAPSEEYRHRLISKALGVSPSQGLEIRAALVEAGLISDDFQPLKWGDRQFVSDGSAARMRKHRNGVKRHGDATVTPKSQRESQIQSESQSQSQKEKNKNPEPVKNWSADEEAARTANITRLRSIVQPTAEKLKCEI